MAVISRFKCAGITDPGRKRTNNEDRFHFDPDRGIFFVVDGVGGQNAGEKAADTACKLLKGRLERQTGDVEDRIREAITVANNEIYKLAQANPEWHGMACVLTVAVVEDGEVVIGQVGDSRLYLMEPGEIRKITHDHSPVGEREDRGEIDEISAMRHPRRNEVYRDVGSQYHSPDDPDFIEITRAPFPAGSAMLLCSDGLSDLVPSREILRTVESHASNAKRATEALVDAANRAGGKDNITIVLVEGSQFAARFGAKPAPASPVAQFPKRSRWFLSRPIFFMLGFLLALGLVAALKPHWRETERGAVFGLGVVREPRTFRVSSDLNAAIEGARPGDTVMVLPGVYDEQLRLKDGVRVVAERPREAVITTSGVGVVAENVRSGRLEGFRIVPAAEKTLSVGLQIRNSDVEIVDNEVTGATSAAVEMLGSSGGILRANHIYANPGAGIILKDEAITRVVHNVVSGNGHAGILIQSTRQPVLIGNTIARNREELAVAPSYDRDSAFRQNFIGVPETPKPQPGRRASTR